MLNRNFAIALAVAMVLAALYGCSSNGGIKDDRDAALVAQMAAEDERDAALAAQTAAEQERDAANAAKTVAEAAQAAAEAAKDMAEADAMTAVMEAEAAEAAAVAAQVVAEAARAAAEAAKDMAEADAMTAVMEAEAAEAAAVAAQADAEAARDAAVAALAVAEAARDAAVTAQADAEAAQKTAEDALAAALVTVSYNQAYAAYSIANMTYINAMVAYGAMNSDVDEAGKLLAAAQAAMTAANNAMVAATNGTPEEQEQARTAVTAAGTAVSAANAEVAQAATTAADMPYAMAIQKVEMDIVAGMGGGATAKRTGNTVTVTAIRGADTADAMDDVTIAKDQRAGGPSNGWYKAELTNTDDSLQTATVYTDIEDTMEKFTVFHGDGMQGVDTVDANGVLTLNTNDDAALVLFNSYADASLLPEPSQGTLMVSYGDDENPETTDNPSSFAGTFNGITGKFGCTGTCSVTADTTGITDVMGTWTFTPDYLGPDGMSQAAAADHNADEAAAATKTREDDLAVPNVPVSDDDYLRFGWWTTVDEDDDSVTFRTFYGGADPYDVDDIDLLEGSATYKGPAAGRYAAKTFNANATLDSLRHGTFTADATLTARFGGDNIAASMQNQIEGEIDNFKDEDGTALSGWSVKLMPILAIDDVNTTGPFTGGIVNGGVGGSPITSGGWEGQFFGNLDDPATATSYPGSVAGKFDAHSSHGHVGGAFGAEKQ